MSKNIAKVEASTAVTTITAADLDYMQSMAGRGTEQITSKDMSIPFLRILAQLSPQVNKRDGAYVEGAEAGFIYNTASNEAYNGEKGVEVIPCYYSSRIIEWKPREKGGGFVASHHYDDKLLAKCNRDDRGNMVYVNGNYLVETMQFFVLLLHEDGPQPCIITMSSSQLKKGKRWNTTIKNPLMKGSDGKMFQLAMFATKYLLRTVPEQNDKGTWFSWDISKIGLVNDRDLTDMASGFSDTVSSGDIVVKENDNTDHAEEVRARTIADEVL